MSNGEMNFQAFKIYFSEKYGNITDLTPDELYKNIKGARGRLGSFGESSRKRIIDMLYKDIFSDALRSALEDNVRAKIRGEKTPTLSEMTVDLEALSESAVEEIFADGEVSPSLLGGITTYEIGKIQLSALAKLTETPAMEFANTLGEKGVEAAAFCDEYIWNLIPAKENLDGSELERCAIALRGLDILHDERSILWRILHPISYIKEGKAIERLWYECSLACVKSSDFADAFGKEYTVDPGILETEEQALREYVVERVRDIDEIGGDDFAIIEEAPESADGESIEDSQDDTFEVFEFSENGGDLDPEIIEAVSESISAEPTPMQEEISAQESQPAFEKQETPVVSEVEISAAPIAPAIKAEEEEPLSADKMNDEPLLALKAAEEPAPAEKEETVSESEEDNFILNIGFDGSDKSVSDDAIVVKSDADISIS